MLSSDEKSNEVSMAAAIEVFFEKVRKHMMRNRNITIAEALSLYRKAYEFSREGEKA